MWHFVDKLYLSELCVSINILVCASHWHFACAKHITQCVKQQHCSVVCLALFIYIFPGDEMILLQNVRWMVHLMLVDSSPCCNALTVSSFCIQCCQFVHL
jgi:hypothetical protein